MSTKRNLNLIVGAGNMGLRRADIYKYLGEGFQFHDPLKGTNKHHPYEEYKSIWIATPSKTHEDAITEILDSTGGLVPLGVEKPVLAHPSSIITHRLGMLSSSFVGCNYRYNQWYADNIDKIDGVDFGYPTFEPLDLIHFYDLYYTCRGIPSKVWYKDGMLYLSYGDRLIEIWGERTNTERYHQTHVNGSVEYGHNNDKDMFLKEMVDWFRVVEGRIPYSPNPFSRAIARTTELYNCIYNGYIYVTNGTNELAASTEAPQAITR